MRKLPLVQFDFFQLNQIYTVTSRIKFMTMKLGAFSVSLAVKDIHKSKAFYEALGFEQFAGEIEQNWIILKHEQTVVGLFQGMFEGNIMTFNPQWAQDGGPLDGGSDIRSIEQHLLDQGIELNSRTEQGSTGPANFTLTDPDGNAILFDQHV